MPAELFRNILIILLILVPIGAALAWWNSPRRGTLTQATSQGGLPPGEPVTELEQRFRKVSNHLATVELNPELALDNPGWLDFEHPMVRQYQQVIAQAIPVWEQATDKADIDLMIRLVDRLENFQQHVDHSLKLDPIGTGNQFLLEPRWSHQMPAFDVQHMANSSSAVTYAIDLTKHHWPISRNTLKRTVAVPEQFIFEAQLEQLLARLVRRDLLAIDDKDFIWPVDVDPAQWGVYRVLAPNTANDLGQVSPDEIANAAWWSLENPVPLEDAIVQTAVTLRIRDVGDELSSDIRHWILQALHRGVATGKLHIWDGQVSRKRRSWPALYRASKF